LEGSGDQHERVPPVYKRHELFRKACEHYNKRKQSRTGWNESQPADPETASEDFLMRISVNYLRHTLTPYDDELLDDLRGRVAKDEAAKRIRERALQAIAKAYPWLKNECDRQRRA
jgi:hypothetical protein